MRTAQGGSPSPATSSLRRGSVRSQKKILPLWPQANQPGLANNYFAASSAPYNRHTVDAKVNYNASSKLTMFTRIGIIAWDEYYDPLVDHPYKTF
jgi:hypothetical protein